MVEDLAASYIALKLENEILQAQVQRLMEENAALQAQIPELQKPRAATQEPAKPSKPLDPSASWDPPAPPGSEEPQKRREPQELPAWGTPAAQEPKATPRAQETQKPRALPPVHGLSPACESQKPPEAKELEKPPMALENQKLLEVKEAQEPPDPKDAPEAQHSGPQDPPNAQEPQETPEGQETSTYLEPHEHRAPQGPLESLLPPEPLDPSEAQERLEGLVAVETSAASKLPQPRGGLEAEAFLLEYPLAFNGNAQKLPEFLVQLNSYMRVRGHLYPTEAALVSFVGNRFSGEAGRWFQPLVDIQSPLLEQFESFMQVLQDTFDNPENMDNANHRLRQLCQGEDPVQYATHFHLIAQVLNWDRSPLCIQFQEGLASSFRDERSHTSPATDLPDPISQRISAEEKLSGKPDLNAQGASSSEERAGPEGPPAGNRPVQEANNRPHLSEAERARRRVGHLCLYCGHPGHFARDCPVKPHRAQQAGNFEARR
ncbi:retrotransposon Gag-like protein 3 [Pteronotus mesoamericanus]|uniref:retrotransposon Gag-like protein 3 n=1 Tax=Pteronotus mesoamericanus TaxID=1884717 RepID=UPI0023ED4B6B|nr:retrotransposon Gag-like protein 3 [Pteronotus parnellii mesoamericanus]